MQRRKHQQLLGRWLNFTKPDEVTLLSESALEAPTHGPPVGNSRRRGRLNSTNSNRDGECLDASFSLNEDTCEPWEHPLSSNASVASVQDSHSVCVSTSSSTRRIKSSLSPSKRTTGSAEKANLSPIKSNAQDHLLVRSPRHGDASGLLHTSHTAKRTDSTPEALGDTPRTAGTDFTAFLRSELRPLPSSAEEISPSAASAASPIEPLSLMMREIDLNESILRDDSSTTLTSPIIRKRRDEQVIPFSSNASPRPVDDEFQMSFAVHELLLTNADDGPDVEVFKKSMTGNPTRRGQTCAVLQQSFESSGGGIDEFVAVASSLPQDRKTNVQSNFHQAYRSEKIHRREDTHAMRGSSSCGISLDQRNGKNGNEAITIPLRSPGRSTALDRTTCWNDTLDDGIKFRRVANGNPNHYEEFGTVYTRDDTAIHTVQDVDTTTVYLSHHQSINLGDLKGDRRCFEPRMSPDPHHPFTGHSSPSATAGCTYDDEERENELIRFAIEQSLSESGAVSYQNDFHDTSSVSTSQNMTSRQSERSHNESFSHNASFSTQRRGVIGPEDVSISEDQEREMIELALERSLQDSRASQSHASISSRGSSVSTSQTLESAEKHLYTGTNPGSSHSRTSLTGASNHSRRSFSASPKSHTLAPETFILPRQIVSNGPHESALLLMLDDDDYDEDELLAPACLTQAHASLEHKHCRNDRSETCSAHPPQQEHSMYPPACFPFSPLQNPSKGRPAHDMPSLSSSCSLDGRPRSSLSTFGGKDRPRYRWELELPSSNQRSVSPFAPFDNDDEDYEDLSGQSTARNFQPSPASWARGRSQSYHRDSRIAASINFGSQDERSIDQSHGQCAFKETGEERAARMEHELVEMALHRSMSEM